MEKRKLIPKAVYDILVNRLGMKKSTLKMRVYKGDLTILEMIKSEIKIHDEKQKADREKSLKLKKQIRKPRTASIVPN